MSSRVKKCLEPTVEKYIQFLVVVKNNQDDKYASMDFLIEQHKINKSVRKAMIDLAIIDYKKNSYWLWLSFEPSRTLALTVLNYLLERSKKSRTTVIAGLEETNAVLRSLSEKVTEYIHRRETSLKVPQIASNGNLFSQQDTKQDLINKAAFAIATGVYEKYGLAKDHNIYDISERNERIVFSAKDLVNQLLK